MVMATAAILILATCAKERPNSPLMTGISGAQANQAKKHTKNAIHVRWNARMGGVAREKSAMRVAFWLAMSGSRNIPLIKQNGARPRR